MVAVGVVQIPVRLRGSAIFADLVPVEIERNSEGMRRPTPIGANEGHNGLAVTRERLASLPSPPAPGSERSTEMVLQCNAKTNTMCAMCAFV